MGDQNFQKQIAKADKHASYTSGSIQNEIIECIGRLTLNKILTKARESGYYSIGFDESSDTGKKEQMAIVIRYLDQDVKQIREDSISLVSCYKALKSLCPEQTFHSLNGKNLALIVSDILRKCGIDKMRIVGFSTDGASVMMSARCGAVKYLKEESPHACHTVCLNHSLNLGVNIGLKNDIYDDVFKMLKDCYNFFK